MHDFFENVKSKFKDMKPAHRGILITVVLLLIIGIGASSENTKETSANAIENTTKLATTQDNTLNTNNTNTHTYNEVSQTLTNNINSNVSTITSSNNVSESTNKILPPTPATYIVKRVVDGDTLKIDYNGKEESVRLIGVDTPESVHPDKTKNTEFGKKASEFSKKYLEGKQITLEFDTQERDKYGRLLAYVYLDGVMYNKTLLQEGYAQIATYPPNVKYVDEFTAIQEEARNNQKGLWAYETTPTENTTIQKDNTQSAISQKQNSATESNANKEENPANESTTIKSNSNNSNQSNIQYNGQSVYKSQTGKKYHYSSSCSNMKNPTKITLEEAKNLGLEPCKKCVL